MSTQERGDRFQELEEAYKDYTVYDQHYEKIGKVDDLFVDENDQPEYIGVKTGFLGMKSTLVPMEIARVNDRRKLIEVAADKDTVQSAPSFDDDENITPEHEARIYGYFGLEHPGLQQGRGGYGSYYASDPYAGEDLAGSVDTEYGERRDESLASASGGTSTGGGSYGSYDTPSPTTSGSREPGGGTSGSDEPARAEEAPQTGTGGQQSGGVRVYKRVRNSS